MDVCLILCLLRTCCFLSCTRGRQCLTASGWDSTAFAEQGVQEGFPAPRAGAEPSAPNTALPSPELRWGTPGPQQHPSTEGPVKQHYEKYHEALNPSSSAGTGVRQGESLNYMDRGGLLANSSVELLPRDLVIACLILLMWLCFFKANEEH